jgi:hypothetical protein
MRSLSREAPAAKIIEFRAGPPGQPDLASAPPALFLVEIED